MIEVLEFTFDNIIHFIGVVILLTVIIEGVTEWIKVFKSETKNK
jgi:hypothetical protein